MLKEKKKQRLHLFLLCPGKKEEDEAKEDLKKNNLGRNLVVGTTGENFTKLIKLLNEKRPEIFTYLERYDYRITNASEKIHYEKSTRDTEPSCEEIRTPVNLERLLADIENYEYIITFGEKAACAVSHISNELTITPINIPHHLGMQGSNHIRTDIDGSEIISVKESQNKLASQGKHAKTFNCYLQ